MKLVFDSVTHTYGSQTVLSSFSAVLESGGAYAVTGSSGIGKTTLLRLLLGLEKPEAGTITADGLPVKKPLHAGVLFQEDRLFEQLTAVENITALYPAVAAEAARAALLRLLPETALDKPVSAFSGGMKRRCALVRACLSPAPLLVLDEPFAALDEENRRLAAAFIEEERRGRTLVTALHSAAQLPFCREIRL